MTGDRYTLRRGELVDLSRERRCKNLVVSLSERIERLENKVKELSEDL